jgi:hypothetical protein
MSKASKSKKREERKQEKYAAKRKKREMYFQYAKEGRKKGSKRFRSKIIKIVKNILHKDGKCGNPACQKCYRINFYSFIKKGKTVGMPHWIWLRYSSQID